MPMVVRLLCSDTLPQILRLILLEICVCTLLGAVREYESFTSPETLGGSHVTCEPVFLWT